MAFTLSSAVREVSGHGNRKWRPHVLNHSIKSREETGNVFNCLMPTPRDILLPARPLFPNIPQTTPPTGEKVFKHTGLWGNFSFRPWQTFSKRQEYSFDKGRAAGQRPLSVHSASCLLVVNPVCARLSVPPCVYTLHFPSSSRMWAQSTFSFFRRVDWGLSVHSLWGITRV